MKIGQEVHGDIATQRKIAVATVPAEEAVVLLRPGAGAPLRRAAAEIQADVAGPDEETPWDRVRAVGIAAMPLLVVLKRKR